MMYIYVPFRFQDLSTEQIKTIKLWAKSKVKASENPIITFFGQKGLMNLPKDSEILILLPGKAGQISTFVKQNKISNKIASLYTSTNAHLRLSEGKQSILVPKIANDMVDDALLNNSPDSILSIQLIFLNEEKQAKALAESFNEALKEHLDQNKTIKVDYKTDLKVSKPASSKSPIKLNVANSEKNPATLNLLDLASALDQYLEYKSSRCCGLSGLFGFNRLFSSNESLITIKKLRNSSTSDEERFAIAKLFVEQHSENYFAECLKPILEKQERSRLSGTEFYSQSVENMCR